MWSEILCHTGDQSLTELAAGADYQKQPSLFLGKTPEGSGYLNKDGLCLLSRNVQCVSVCARPRLCVFETGVFVCKCVSDSLKLFVLG